MDVLVTPDDKYRHLEGTALAVLRNPLRATGFVQLIRPSLRCVLWSYPAFEPYQSWALIKEETVKDMWLLRRVTWYRSEDYARALDPIRQAGFMAEAGPSPTLDAVDVKASASFATRTLDAVGSLELPDLPHEKTFGLDGVMNGVAIHDRHVELEWWCEGPPTWRRFTDGVEMVRQQLETAIGG